MIPHGDKRREEPDPFACGARVWVELVKDHGVIRSLSRDGRRAVVDVGDVSLNVPLSTLANPHPASRKESTRSVATRPRGRCPGRGSREIDMHGLRVEEMIARLDAFLNNALLDGCQEVRVVHGHGSGALRKALHQHLAKLGIRHFRLGEMGQTPGGDGVTVISL